LEQQQFARKKMQSHHHHHHRGPTATMAASTHVVTLAGPSAQDLSSSVQQKAGQGHILSCGSSSIGCGNSSPGEKDRKEGEGIGSPHGKHPKEYFEGAPGN